jgi:hypothetical protein
LETKVSFFLSFFCICDSTICHLWIDCSSPTYCPVAKLFAPLLRRLSSLSSRLLFLQSLLPLLIFLHPSFCPLLAILRSMCRNLCPSLPPLAPLPPRPKTSLKAVVSKLLPQLLDSCLPLIGHLIRSCQSRPLLRLRRIFFSRNRKTEAGQGDQMSL